jgi:hypothetical protein
MNWEGLSDSEPRVWIFWFNIALHGDWDGKGRNWVNDTTTRREGILAFLFEDAWVFT